MKLGVCIRHHQKMDIEVEFQKAVDLGFEKIQLVSWQPDLWTADEAKRLTEKSKLHGLEITELWVGWRGPASWNFYDGHETLGLLPAAYRYVRMEDLKAGADFAKWMGIEKIITHAGFIPENPHDPNYAAMVSSLRVVAKHLQTNGQALLLETGQETPVTLLRTIQDVGTENLLVNLDPANLIMYGKANPVDAIDTLGPYISSVHAKDGLYPTDGHKLGPEVKLGSGKVNFPALLAALKEAGFDGVLTIEREISGEQQIADIQSGKALLEGILAQL